MSAHLCLTAWKEPMGRPNWNRVLAYPALISRHLRAPPACSAASATQARSSTRLISRPAWPSAPTRTAGTWSKVRTAIGRVGSSVVIGSARSPGAPRSTANRPGPAVLRATTSTRSAIAPSMTKFFFPLSAQPAGVRSARAETMAGSHDAWPSAAASVAMVWPAAMPGRYRAQAAWSAEASSAWAASTTVAKKGEHSQRGPHLLQHHLELGQAEPVAAVVAGQRQARQPELAGHLVPHRRVVHPPLSMAARTALSRDLAARNSRTASRSSSSSSLPSFMTCASRPGQRAEG